MNGDDRHAGAVALLAWWREMGIDGVLDDEPTDWLAREGRPPGDGFVMPGGEATAPSTTSPTPAPAPAPTARSAPTPVASPPPARQFPTAAPDAATTAARTLARSAGDLEGLRAALERFDGCGLKATATRLCLYRGSPRARLMIIGEAPGREEDQEGKPFVGRAGKLLDRMLTAIGLTEADVHITNIVYWRPPGNRVPTPLEVQVCRPFLERQIAMVAPEMILTLGGPAAKAMLSTEDGIMRLRGRWREAEVGGRQLPVMPTLHPAYLLRTPAAKRNAWRDLLAVKERLDGTPAKDQTQ